MAETPAPYLSDSQARFLTESRTGHLATADAQGVPHVIPVCFVFDGHVIYSVLDQKPKRAPFSRLKRVRNIQANPQVALVVDHYDEDWRKLRYILVHGTAQLIENGPDQEQAVNLLRAKYPQYRSMDIEENPVIKITPSRAISWSGQA